MSILLTGVAFYERRDDMDLELLDHTLVCNDLCFHSESEEFDFAEEQLKGKVPPVAGFYSLTFVLEIQYFRTETHEGWEHESSVSLIWHKLFEMGQDEVDTLLEKVCPSVYSSDTPIQHPCALEISKAGAAGRSDESLTLAMKLAGALACPKCKYVVQHCRCSK